METFVCPACRLLQPSGSDCVECGKPIAELDAARALLRYRDASDVTERSVSGRATVAGVGVATVTSCASVMLLGPIALAALPVIAYGSMIGAGALASLRARRYGTIVAVGIPDPALAEGAIQRTGIARPLTGPVTSKLDGAPILAEQIVIRDGSSILLRRVFATPFVIRNDEAPEELVVLGEVRLATPVTSTEQRGTDLMFELLGIPGDLLPKKVTVDIRTLRPGTIVAVHGVTEEATLPELAALRGGGQVLAMQGRRGSLVVIRAH